MDIIIALIALFIGVVVGFFVGRSQKNGIETKASMLEQQLNEQKKTLENQIVQVRETGEKLLAEAKIAYEKQIAGIKDSYEKQITDTKDSYEKQISDVKTEHKEQLAALQAQQEKQILKMQETQKEQMETNMNLLREQLKTSAEKVLKERSAELADNNKEQLAQILNPLQTNLQQMKEEVEKNRTERNETMTSLKAVINTTMEQTRLIGERADNLANALTRDNKYQGNFGELRLSKMLEEMGFERGKQFEEQVTIRDEEGKTVVGEESEKRMQPDVILHFPDNRDIIIDSKVSMTAFERWANAKTDEEKKLALKEHVLSVRNQVKLLTQKTYWKQYNQKGVKLDFVVMFMFSESALQLALTEDPTLWHDAYGKGVLITGGQNLYALLRILELSWKQMAQVENQENIMRCADDIVSRVQLFYQRFLEVEDKMNKVSESMKDMKHVIAPTGKSIVTAATKLLDYGAKEDAKRKKSLPKATDEEPSALPVAEEA